MIIIYLVCVINNYLLAKRWIPFSSNVASVGSAFKGARKVKVLSLPETIKENLTLRAKALRWELVV